MLMVMVNAREEMIGVFFVCLSRALQVSVDYVCSPNAGGKGIKKWVWIIRNNMKHKNQKYISLPAAYTLCPPAITLGHSATLTHRPSPLLTYVLGPSKPTLLGLLRIGLPTILTLLRRIEAMTFNLASLSAAALCRMSVSEGWYWYWRIG